MEKIKVMVNDVLNRIGSTTIRNVISQKEMELVPISITGFSSKNGDIAKMRIDQNVVSIINPEEVIQNGVSDVLFNYGRPDVVVDCNLTSPFLESIPDCLTMNTSFVFFIPLNLQEETKRLKKAIKNLGVNIFIFWQKPKETEILSAIKFLYQKQIANDFGNVFAGEAIA